MTNVEQWDRNALQELWKSGAMSLHDMMRAVPIDQFELPATNSWVDSALERNPD